MKLYMFILGFMAICNFIFGIIAFITGSIRLLNGEVDYGGLYYACTALNFVGCYATVHALQHYYNQ